MSWKRQHPAYDEHINDGQQLTALKTKMFNFWYGAQWPSIPCWLLWRQCMKQLVFSLSEIVRRRSNISLMTTASSITQNMNWSNDHRTVLPCLLYAQNGIFPTMDEVGCWFLQYHREYAETTVIRWKYGWTVHMMWSAWCVATYKRCKVPLSCPLSCPIVLLSISG